MKLVRVAAMLIAVLLPLNSCSHPAANDLCSGAAEATNADTAANVRDTDGTDTTHKDTPPTTETKEAETMSITITVGGKTFTAALADTDAAREFFARLPLRLDMSELNGNEKYFYLDDALPTAPSVPDVIREGDIMLYGSSCVVIFYKSFSTTYSYTALGHLDDATGLSDALGSGSATVTFERNTTR